MSNLFLCMTIMVVYCRFSIGIYCQEPAYRQTGTKMSFKFLIAKSVQTIFISTNLRIFSLNLLDF